MTSYSKLMKLLRIERSRNRWLHLNTNGIKMIWL
nr:MAG TPA: hypothetical protein [Caudoviricetes sp.]